MRAFLHGWRLPVVLLVAVVALAGCGHVLAAVSGHHAAWCAFHGWRAFHDLKRHHPGWGAFQVWRAVHHCGRVL